MDKLVSIITPCYQAENHIADTIRSVQRQTYTNWEMIIVDDSSKDKTLEIVTRFQSEDTRLKLIVNSMNRGVALTRNSGLKVATGDYIAFLDSDDLWFPEKLDKQLRFMERNDVFMSYSGYDLIDSAGGYIGNFVPKLTVSYNDLLKSSEIGMLTTIYNAKKIGKHYFTDIGHEDYLMKLQILKKIGKAKGLAGPMASYRITHGSLSGDKMRAAKWQWEIYRKHELLPIFTSLFYFTHYLLKGAFKNSKRYRL